MEKKSSFNFGMLLSDNARSRAYLDILIKNNFLPRIVFLINGNSITKKIKLKKNSLFENSIRIEKILIKHCINYRKLTSNSVNSSQCFNVIKHSSIKCFIYSGNYGEILKKNYFKIKKTFLHVHPGKLPKYKGSTPFYYEILEKSSITFSSIIMNEKIDSGQILLFTTYKISKKNKIDKSQIDLVYDPYYRSLLLMKTLLKMKKIHFDKKSGNKIKTNNLDNYYIIHPVLKHLAILK